MFLMLHIMNGATALAIVEQGKTMKKIAIGVAVILASALVGCGGSSGGGSIQASSEVTSFPLQAGYKALIAGGLQKTFTVSGTCSGSGSKTTAPASTSATFEGSAALSSAATLTISFTNCTPASIAQTFTSYVDSNYAPLGFNSVGVSYGVFLTPPSIPSSVFVGATATIGTETFYTDSTKKIGNGTQVLSYVVQADTSTTAVINFISKIFNSSGTLTAIEQDFYRINASGTLAPLTSDIQYSNGSTTHLVLTYSK